MPHPAPLTIRQLSVGICISYLFPSQLYQQYAILIFKAIVNLSQNKNLVKHHLPGPALTSKIYSVYIKSVFWLFCSLYLTDSPQKSRTSPPVFRRSTRKIPTFHSSRLSSSVPSNLDFSHIYRKFLMPFLGSFLLKKFLGYVIIIVLYSTLFGGRLWHTI